MQLHARAVEILAAQVDLPAVSTVAKLRDYGVSAEMLATATIEQHFAAADEILDRQLDKLARQFKKGHAEFVSRYRNARVIVNVAASRAAADPAPAPVLPGKA